MTNWDQATYEALQEDIRVPEVILNEAVNRQIASLQNENEVLRESIAEVRAMMNYEDLGWQLIAG